MATKCTTMPDYPSAFWLHSILLDIDGDFCTYKPPACMKFVSKPLKMQFRGLLVCTPRLNVVCRDGPQGEAASIVEHTSAFHLHTRPSRQRLVPCFPTIHHRVPCPVRSVRPSQHVEQNHVLTFALAPKRLDPRSYAERVGSLLRRHRRRRRARRRRRHQRHGRRRRAGGRHARRRRARRAGRRGRPGRPRRRRRLPRGSRAPPAAGDAAAAGRRRVGAAKAAAQ